MDCQNLYTEIDTHSNQPAIDVEMEEPDILTEEVVYVMRKLKHNKASGPDQISADILQATGNVGIEVMRQLCNKIWQTKQ